VYLLFCNYLPLKKGVSFHEGIESLSSGIICVNLGKIWSSDSGVEVKNVKLYRERDGQWTTCDRQKISVELLNVVTKLY
jgi:hypothetical protein